MSVMHEDPPCAHTGYHPPAQGSVSTLMLQFIKQHDLHRPHVSSSEAHVRQCLRDSAQLCGFPAAVGAGGWWADPLMTQSEGHPSGVCAFRVMPWGLTLQD